MTDPDIASQSVEASPTIHVLLGTKAQYVKTVPLLREMDQAGVPYRLVDLGQHGAFSVGLRDELDVRQPDVMLGGSADVETIGSAIVWVARLLLLTINKRKLQRNVFGGAGGICVIHGDTPSTFVAAVMAWRAGLEIAHLEAGLRSRSILNPFPEELIRLIVMRMADVLFAPSDEAAENLAAMRLGHRTVRLPANSVIEMMSAPGNGPLDGGRVVVTCHRVENIKSRGRLRRIVDLASLLSERHDVTFVLHPPTQASLRESDMERLQSSGVELVPLLPHSEFLALLESAEFVITDGGSIQEECAVLGVPTLLWRKRSERSDGLGRNVVLSRFDQTVIDEFLANPEAYRVDRQPTGERPSLVAMTALTERLGR